MTAFVIPFPSDLNQACHSSSKKANKSTFTTKNKKKNDIVTPGLDIAYDLSRVELLRCQ